MRGKALRVSLYSFRARITPAYAGKSKQPFLDFLSVGDHPRLCGEKNEEEKTAELDTGSPPPMRGKVSKVFCLVLIPRITPAYAGKRALSNARSITNQDHPRLCGEKFNNGYDSGMIK